MDNLGPYLAKVRLKILNAPGSVPSSTRVMPGEVFSFDEGDKVDIGLLLRAGAIVPFEKPLKKVVKDGKDTR